MTPKASGEGSRFTVPLRHIASKLLIWRRKIVAQSRIAWAAFAGYLTKKTLLSPERFLPWTLLLCSLLLALYSWHFKAFAPPVGVYIAILATAAAVSTFYPPVSTAKWDRVAWIGVFAILMILEVRNLYQDREEHNHQQVLLSTSIGQQGQTLQGMAQNLQLSFSSISTTQASLSQTLASLNMQSKGESSKELVPRPPPEIMISASYGNLRERAINLSQELYRLTSQQQQETQAALSKAEPSKSTSIVDFYTNKLSIEYSWSYEDRVKQIRDDFAKLNIRDTDLEEMLKELADQEEMEKKYPMTSSWKVNGGMVLSIARYLTNLARKLPAS
jgi:hypothetical protein